MLNYRLYGELSAGPPLVVLHGLLGSLDNWHTFARGQEGKRTVLAIDLRNHGASPPVEGMSYPAMVADVLEVLDALFIPQCDLMGHSMGGKVAMLLALQHPASVRRLVVVDIAPKTYPARHQALLQAMLAMPLAGMKSRKQADEWLSLTVKHPFERGFLLKNLGRDAEGGFHWQCNLPEIVRHYAGIAAFPVVDMQFLAPTLFICGGQSDYVMAVDLIRIGQYFPLAVVETLEVAGHLPHVQTPEAFTALVRAFLA